jgi:malate dehydrogenase (oxaloacetate-decarboxylating)(NADP+)
MKNADVFVGLSAGNVVTPDMLKTMAKKPIVFAMANPVPEIDYDLAAGTRDDIIMATGRSDFPNQVNNVLGFPYIFRGALDVRATAINEEMKIAATHAIAELAKKPVPEAVNLSLWLPTLNLAGTISSQNQWISGYHRGIHGGSKSGYRFRCSPQGDHRLGCL